MEYLEMRGEVKLKENVDKTVLGLVLRKLKSLEFINAGFMDISLNGKTLNIHAEGTILESYSLKALLIKLQTQLTDTSMIGVSSVKWETLVVLKHWGRISALQLEPKSHLLFAQ